MNIVSVCVSLGSAESKKEKRREMVVGLLHRDMRLCMENLHVKMRWHPYKSTLPLGWAWAENGEGRKENLGLECLSPFYG